MTVLSKFIVGAATLGSAAAMQDDSAWAFVKNSMDSHAASRLLTGKTAADCPYAAKLHRKQMMWTATDENQRKLIEARLEMNTKGEDMGNARQLLRGRKLQNNGSADARMFLADYMTCWASGGWIPVTSVFGDADYEWVYTLVKSAIDRLPNQEWKTEFAGCVVRLAGHDLMDFDPTAPIGQKGGSDGCIDFRDPDNMGLADCVDSTLSEVINGQKLALNSIYEQVCDKISLADFVVLWAEATMAASSKNADATKAVFKNAFRWGRRTAPTCAFAQGRLPAAEEGCPALTTKIADRLFGEYDTPLAEPAPEAARFGPLTESWVLTAALSGAHTMGKAEAINSGYQGMWSSAASQGQFNNDYYHSLLYKGWGVDRNVNGRIDRNQWQRVDLGWAASNANPLTKEIMLNSDMCLAYGRGNDNDNINNAPPGPARALQRGGRGGGGRGGRGGNGGRGGQEERPPRGPGAGVMPPPPRNEQGGEGQRPPRGPGGNDEFEGPGNGGNDGPGQGGLLEGLDNTLLAATEDCCAWVEPNVMLRNMNTPVAVADGTFPLLDFCGVPNVAQNPFDGRGGPGGRGGDGRGPQLLRMLQRGGRGGPGGNGGGNGGGDGGQGRRECCRTTNANNCNNPGRRPRGTAIQAVEAFAADEGLFIAYFTRAWAIATTNSYNMMLLKLDGTTSWVIPEAIIPRTTADVERPLLFSPNGMGPWNEAWNSTEWEECRRMYNGTGDYHRKTRNGTNENMRNGTYDGNMRNRTGSYEGRHMWNETQHRMRNGTHWEGRNGTDFNGTDIRGGRGGRRRGGRRGGRGRNGNGRGGRGNGGRRGPCSKYFEDKDDEVDFPIDDDEDEFDPELPNDGDDFDEPISEFPGIIGGPGPIVVPVPLLNNGTTRSNDEGQVNTQPADGSDGMGRLGATETIDGITFQQVNSAESADGSSTASADTSGTEKKQESSAYSVTIVSISSQLIALAATFWTLTMFDLY